MENFIAYDITHEDDDHPDDKDLGKIIENDEEDILNRTYFCSEYDYILTPRELIDGFLEGWAETSKMRQTRLECARLVDKLHRRNALIKKLREKIRKLDDAESAREYQIRKKIEQFQIHPQYINPEKTINR